MIRSGSAALGGEISVQGAHSCLPPREDVAWSEPSVNQGAGRHPPRNLQAPCSGTQPPELRQRLSPLSSRALGVSGRPSQAEMWAARLRWVPPVHAESRGPREVKAGGGAARAWGGGARAKAVTLQSPVSPEWAPHPEGTWEGNTGAKRWRNVWQRLRELSHQYCSQEEGPGYQ